MTAPDAARPTAADLADRAGLDEQLLGVPVPLPALREPLPTARLDYTHFSVLMRLDRRLAAVAAVGIDGALLRDRAREGSDWEQDRGQAGDKQTGAAVDARSDVERSGQVRRADGV